VSDDPKQQDLDRDRVGHDGKALTTDQGVKVAHTDDSLRAGDRGPTLIEDFHFREKLTRFDHERIPERVVHARGSGAYGTFTCTEALTDVTRADFLAEAGRETPVFVRFSTVGGSRGSADTVRDVRGFATKFYTREGNYDLVGNNMPVFFIQDGIKFPDFVHAVKPEPPHEMPQASSAHDTFYDFISLQPESLHMLMWLMSDRAIPRSYRTMEGFGVHTYRFVNAAGEGTFVKFHWRPLLGAHSLVWDEAQKIAGADPDFNRRDLWEAIESGHGPEYDLAVQLVPEAREHDFDFDLLDPTKIIPEEEVPLRVVGRMKLDRNPDNFFAETEQAAFCVQNVVPGIDFTNDPLLQARLFSYLDTQLIRLGGPNFAQLPVNRPVAEVHHHQRDGYGQHRIDTSPVSYHPNSIGGGCPHLASVEEGAFRHYTERIDGHVVRRRSESFADHYTQATLFYNSLSDWERQHLTEALQFELGKVEREHIRERMVEHLARIDSRLGSAVAEGLGLPAPARNGDAPNGRRSPALSQAEQPQSVATRKVAVLAADGADAASLAPVLEHLTAQGAICEVLAPHGGTLEGGVAVDRLIVTMASVLYDGVLVAGGAASAQTLAGNGGAMRYVAEAFKHAKPVAALGDGVELLREARLPGVRLSENGLVAEAGVVTLAQASGDDLEEFSSALCEAIAQHRHFDRELAAVPA
jgi:catalase